MAIDDGHPRSPHPDATLMGQFESIGDNCEFGFVQWYHGVDEAGLLRFASTVLCHDQLMLGFAERFERVFEPADTVPHAGDMMLHRRYGIAFHTRFQNELKDGQWICKIPEDVREGLFAEEVAKIAYLRRKLLNHLDAGDRILVYKRDPGLSKNEMLHLKSLVPRCRLLCVAQGEPDLRRVAPDLLLGTLRRFAPLDHVQDALYEDWTELCRRAAAAKWA